jgi:Uma2 family endonuclease
MNAIPLQRDDVYYPESDDQPMAETEIHLEETIYLIEALKDRFRDAQDVYVGGDMFLYYVQGSPRHVVAPDVFVVFGVPKRKRRIYKLWEEGQPPALVIEVTSEDTRRKDLGSKKDLYERLGVQEYLLYDPLGDYLNPPIRGFHLVGGLYVPMTLGKDGAIQSFTTGLTFRMEEDHLRLIDTSTGQPLLRGEEARELARQAREAERRAQHAEKKAACLEAELEKLRRQG